MRLFSALFILIALTSTAQAGDHWKITSRGHNSVWAINSSCSCTDGCSCPTGAVCTNGSCSVAPAAKPASTATVTAPVQTGTAIYSSGSCSDGSCSSGTCGQSSGGLFRRRR